MRKARFIEVGFGDVRVAFPMQDIDRVLRAVAVVPVSGAPDCVLGMVDVAGEAVRAYAMRNLLGLPPRAIRSSDRMVLTCPPTRLAFIVDEVFGVFEADPPEPVPSFSMQATGVRGVVRAAGDMLIVHDLAGLLALERAVLLQPHA